MHEDLFLLCLAALGGIMAVAWGSRRLGARDGDAMIDARTQLQVRLDALRARAIVLRRHDGLSPDLQASLDQVIEHHVLIDGVVKKAGTATEVRALEPRLHDAFVTLEQVGRELGVDVPADRPFVGLCSFDPEHGGATMRTASGDEVCPRCRIAVEGGKTPRQRQVSEGGQPLPFTALS